MMGFLGRPSGGEGLCLGIFAGNTALKVRLLGSADGVVVADAARLLEVGPTVKLAYDDAANVSSETDALGRTTNYSHDNLNRVQTVTLPDPDGGGIATRPVYTTEYYTNGAVKREIDPLSNATAYGYDELGRVIKVTEADPDGAGAATSPVTTFAYNAAGDLTLATDAENRTTTYGYDALGRLNSVLGTDPDGTGAKVAPLVTMTLSKTGQLTAWRERVDANTANDLITTYTVDHRDRLLTETKPNGEVTRVVYDAAGNVKELYDGANNKTTWIYDSLDRTTQETNQLGKSRYFFYDADSRLIQANDRTGRFVTYQYDNLDRAIGEQWKNSSGGLVRTLAFSYDTAGRLLSASDPSATYTYTYDSLDRNLQNTSTVAGLTPQVVTTSTWNTLDRRTQLSATVGGVADFKNSYDFDNLSRVTGLRQEGVAGGRAVAQKRVFYTLNQTDDVTFMVRYNNVTTINDTTMVMATTLSRDARGRVTSMSHSKQPNNFLFATFTSDFDSADRLINSSRIANSPAIATTEIASYSYDRGGQLTGVSRSISPTAETYGYDAAGNRSASNGVAYSNTANNRLSSDGTHSYLYDDEGNITRKTLIANANVASYYSYDHRNRLTGISEFNQVGTNFKNVVYAYDVFDRRVVKSIDADGGGAQPYDPTYLVYDGDDVALALKTNGALGNRYLHGPAVDEILADENQYGGVLWALKDQLGNVRDLVDHAGALYNHIDYDTFGRVTSELKPASQGHLIHAYGFQGRERDQESGLNYHRNRYYNPATGRWQSEDPIGFMASDGNLSRFVGNGPTNHSDPYGLDFGDGFVEGLKEQFWGAVDFVNPLTLDDAVYDLFNAPYGEDLEKGKQLLGDPAGYLGNRGGELYDATNELLSTEDGQGKALSYILTAAVTRKFGPHCGGKQPSLTALKSPAAKPARNLLELSPDSQGTFKLIHGNSAKSLRKAYLYRLETQTGEFLKWGVTQDMAKRYPLNFMFGKNIKEFASGSRADMLRMERELVETQPGPLNRERWAGSKLRGGH